MNYYSQHPRFHVAVDCIIFGFQKGTLKVLLQQRSFEPRAGEWSLMGGFVQRDEDVDTAAQRVLLQLTGLDNIYMEQLGAFGNVHRDSGNRVVSIAYFALVNIDLVDAELTPSHSTHWEDINNLPPLLFDHQDMVNKAHKRLIAIIHQRPVGFNLLPEMFTLTQLQQLYEAIIGSPIDKRNFRKRIAELPYIVKTDSIDKVSSKRGAALYRFDSDGYRTGKRFKL